MPDLTTTYDEISMHLPCRLSVGKFRKFFSGRADIQGVVMPNTEIKLSQVLAGCGVEDSFWFLRCFDYKEYCLLLANVCEIWLVNNIFYRTQFDESKRLLQGIRDYENGEQTIKQLGQQAKAAQGTVDDICYFAAYCAPQQHYSPDDIYHEALEARGSGVSMRENIHKLLTGFIKS